MRIIITPTTATSDEVLARLRSWSRSGLLDRFCWWPTPTVGGRVDSFTVQLVAQGELREEMLSAALDGVNREDIRLVAFYAASRSEPFDAVFADAVAARVAEATDVLAFLPGHPVRATMIVAPAATGQHVPAELFRSNWAANVLLAPEDRSTPQSGNVLADTAGVLPAHAAHGLATLADLWISGRPSSEQVLDAIRPREGGPNPVLVVPARCYSRFVDLGYLADHIAAEVFQPRDGSWPNPDLQEFDRIDHPEELLDYIIRRYLRKHEDVLGLTPFTPITIPERPVLTMLAALRWMWDAFIRLMKRKPFEIAEDMLAMVINRAADLIEKHAGPDRPFDVVRWRDKASRMEDLSELFDDLERPLTVPNGPVAETWGDLVRLGLGLIDGAQLPAGIDADGLKLDEKRLVVTRPDRIVPDPTRRPPATEQLPDPRACDPLNLGAASRMAAVDATDQRPGAHLINAGDDARADDERVVDADILDPTVWIEPHRQTPMWIVGDSIAEALEHARVAATDPPQTEPEDHNEAERFRRAKQHAKSRRRARRRQRRRVFFSVLASWTITGVASWGVWSHLPLIVAVMAQLALAVLLAGILVNAARRQKARRDRDARNALEGDVAQLNELLERALRKADVKRLERRYVEYLDWAEIIGYLAHYPWIGEPLRRVDVRSPIDTDTLPAAMKVAIGRTRERIEQLCRQSQKQLFRPRWLSSLYATVEASVMDDLREAEGGALGSVVVAKRNPVSDTSEDPDGDRRHLCAAIRAGKHRRLQDNEFCGELLTFLDGLPIDFATDGVTPVGAADGPAEPLPPSTAWFSPPANLPEMTALLKPTVVRLSVQRASGECVGGTGVIVSTAGVVATARHVVEHASTITVTLSDGTSMPATLSRVARSTDVAIIAVAGASSMTSANLAGARETPLQGEPVITLGHPLVQEGEATLAWGLITATDRHITITDAPEGIGRFAVIQATYASVGGASGSPVFDLDGNVIGIHSAGSVETEGDARAQYLSSAVPVAALHALLGSDTEQARHIAADEVGHNGGGGIAGLARRSPLPSEFLSDLINVPETISFLPDHWLDPTRGRPLLAGPVQPLPDLSGDDGRVGALCGPTGFLVPIRIALHRVEITKPVRPDELSGCPITSER